MKYLSRTGAIFGLRLVLATLVATLATTSFASAFHGIEPGVSHRDEVMKTFGNPSSLLGANNAKILLYSGWKSPAGTSEAQIKIDSATNRVLSVVIFPSRVLTPALVEGMFGRGCGPTKLPGDVCYDKVKPAYGAPYWRYSELGVLVFWNLGGENVDRIAYLPVRSAPPPVVASNNPPVTPPVATPPNNGTKVVPAGVKTPAGKTPVKEPVVAKNNPPAKPPASGSSSSDFPGEPPAQGSGSGAVASSESSSGSSDDHAFDPFGEQTQPGAAKGGDAEFSSGDTFGGGGAESPPSSLKPPNVSGSVRSAYWSSTRTLNDDYKIAPVSVWLKAEQQLWLGTSLHADGWVMNSNLAGSFKTAGHLREAYLAFSAGPIDVWAGQQIVNWGRADGINPTDSISPRDYTMLAPDDADNRLGDLMVRARLNLGSFSISGLWMPYFRPNVLPYGTPPSPVALSDEKGRVFLGQTGVRIEQTGGAVDWSLTYFNGLDLNPNLAKIDETTLPGRLGVALLHERVQVIGADAATTLGQFGIRAEAAYTQTKDDPSNPVRKRPFLLGVIGGDRSFFQYLNINAQYVFRYVNDWAPSSAIIDPVAQGVDGLFSNVESQLDQIQHGATLRISDQFLHETLSAEVLGVVWFTRMNYYVRARVSYALTDRWKLTIGGDYYGGDQETFFGRLKDNAAAMAEMQVTF